MNKNYINLFKLFLNNLMNYILRKQTDLKKNINKMK
jgi:hypothetical protein